MLINVLYKIQYNAIVQLLFNIFVIKILSLTSSLQSHVNPTLMAGEEKIRE